MRRITRRLEKAAEVYELSAPVFLFSPFGELSLFNTPPYKRVAARFYQLDFFRSMHRANRSDFTDPNFVQLFDRYATYNGSDPYRAPATLNMIAHLENNTGAFFPVKGVYSIAAALYTTAKELGVAFRLGEKVDRIITEGNRATGLSAGGRTERFDLVVSDADVKYAANHLMDGHPLKKRLNRGGLSSSALIFYWGSGNSSRSWRCIISFSAGITKRSSGRFSGRRVSPPIRRCTCSSVQKSSGMTRRKGVRTGL